jgi:predicted ATPase
MGRERAPNRKYGVDIQRAAMSMAQLWRDPGKQDRARKLLAPVYGCFTEGFGTLDLKEAQALLDQLT